MRQESKILKAFIEQNMSLIEQQVSLDAPEVAPALVGTICEAKPDCEPVANFSFDELVKAARALLTVNSDNINSLHREKGHRDFMIVDEANFSSFRFGMSKIIAEFKVRYSNDDRSQGVESVSWDGSKFEIY
jgi:hypothetical protein